MMDFIPVNEPVLGAAERRNLEECIAQGWVSSEGPFVRRFEEAVATSVGRKHGVAVSSGSAALEVAVAAMNLGEGDEVIAPTFTIISSVAPLVRAGAVPILIDSDPVTWNMETSRIESLITPRCKAIMAVHIYGLPVNMDAVRDLARRHELSILEDAAEVQGQTYRGKPCGSFGDLSIFSFYANKHVTSGEGGMLLCDDDNLAARCRELRNLCFGSERRFVHEDLGWNFRMTNLQAAVGVAQLDRLELTVARKREIGARYTDGLRGVPGLILPVPRTKAAENIFWVYGLILDDTVGFDAAEACTRLASLGVGSRPFFWPMHEQPVFRNRGLFLHDSHPVAERLARRGFYLPSGAALTNMQIDTVCKAVRKMMR